MNKPLFFLIVTLAATSCRPSEAELRSDLRAIDGEMLSISIAMNQHRARMNESDWAALVGSFATGFGATSGDYHLAADGAMTTSEAMRNYDVSTYSLDQLGARYSTLAAERRDIISQLD